MPSGGFAGLIAGFNACRGSSRCLGNRFFLSQIVSAPLLLLLLYIMYNLLYIVHNNCEES